MQGPWRIGCFGGLKGVLGDLEVSRFRTRRAAVLLAFLALHKHRSHTRDELGLMLWPEADDKAMRARLRLALTSLRHQFEPPFLPQGSVLLTAGDTLQLNPRMVETDVEDFDLLLASAGKTEDESARRDLLERAVAIYRGELLSGYDEEWIRIERARLSHAFENALSQLVDLCADLRLLEPALTYGRRLLSLDPWQEPVHVRVMQVCLDAGDPQAALRQFEDLEAALAELGEQPGSAARQLAEEARSATPVSRGSATTDRVVRDVPAAEPLADERRSTLPVRLTRFFGREEELRLAIHTLESGPGQLLTLTGSGGSGKTRLSTELGYAMESSGWDVWFVPLAGVSTASRIYDAILTTLKIGRGQDPTGDLARFFRTHKRPLLILDNLEHLMDEAADHVGRLLSASGEVKCVVTSRQILSLEGERELTVAPLSTPKSEVTAETAIAHPSVQLYVDRCQAIRPDFQLSSSNAAQIAALCARLEGIPLAIEIAASLTRSLNARQLFEQLTNRLDILVSPRRDIVDRQKTLRNTIAYSFDLLSPELAEFFLGLAIFRGGWSIESAEAVCLHIQPGSCMAPLSQLRERSLIENYESPMGDSRFRMLEVFREFARERVSAERLSQFESVKDAYFLRIAEEAFRAMGTRDEQPMLARLQAEYDNLMDVFERAADRPDAEFGIRLAAGFGQVWRSRGAVAHERAIIERFANMPETELLEPELQMKSLNLLSHASFLLCDWDRSLRAEQRTLEIAERTKNDEYLAVAYGGMSMAFLGLRRRSEALAALEQAVGHARKTDKEQRLSVLVGNLGVVYWRNGDLAEAERCLREAYAMARKQDSDARATHVNLNIARVLVDMGRLDEAFEILPSTLDRATKLHRSHDVVVGLSVMARYYRLRGEIGQAWALTQLAIARALPLMNENLEVYVGVEAALELVVLRRLDEAVSLLSTLASHDKSIGDSADIRGALEYCRQSVGSPMFEKLNAVGMVRGLTETLGYLLTGSNLS